MITLDFETQSQANLKEVGTVAYAEDLLTSIICIGYAIDSDPVRVIYPPKYINSGTVWRYAGERMMIPSDLEQAILDGHKVEAHNVAFEWAIWKNICVARWGWPEIAPEKWRDTMAVAHYYALPGSLDRLAQAIGFGGKDTEGTRLISKYSCLHNKSAQADIPAEDHGKFMDYCAMDVALEREVSNYLGDLPARELPIFLLDQAINQRGLCIDAEGVKVAGQVVEERHAERVAEFEERFGFRPSQVQKLKQWVQERGYELDDLQKGTIEPMLEEGVFDPDTRRALELRLETNRASTKKLKRMADEVSKNGRALYQTRYHGAATGRSTGAGFQPLNLKRGYEDVAPEQLVRDIMYGDPEFLDLLYGDAMDAVAAASRHWIKAEEGNEITAGDYSNIEAVLLACEAGEQWKVDAFRKREPIYELMGCKIHNLNWVAEKLAREDKSGFKAMYAEERQDGKIGELAFGYQGALGAWRQFDPSDRHSDERVIEICRAWRAEHPSIVDFWHTMEATALKAVQHPGVAFKLFERNPIFQTVDEWLTLILPDGKRLWYYQPEIRQAMPKWHDPEVNEDCANDTCTCRPGAKLTYMTQKAGRWQRIGTYGGKLTENYIQALGRQILEPAKLRIHERWKEVQPSPIVLSVYDEIVAEAPAGMIDSEEFEKIMLESPGEWADDYPIFAEVWQGHRYKK